MLKNDIVICQFLGATLQRRHKLNRANEGNFCSSLEVGSYRADKVSTVDLYIHEYIKRLDRCFVDRNETRVP